MSLILIGKSGTGKSTIGNMIIDKMIGEKESFKVGTGKSITKDVSSVKGCFNGINLEVVDTPGIGDTDGDDFENFEKIYTFLNKNNKARCLIMTADSNRLEMEPLFHYRKMFYQTDLPFIIILKYDSRANTDMGLCKKEGIRNYGRLIEEDSDNVLRMDIEEEDFVFFDFYEKEQREIVLGKISERITSVYDLIMNYTLIGKEDLFTEKLITLEKEISTTSSILEVKGKIKRDFSCKLKNEVALKQKLFTQRAILISDHKKITKKYYLENVFGQQSITFEFDLPAVLFETGSNLVSEKMENGKKWKLTQTNMWLGVASGKAVFKILGSTRNEEKINEHNIAMNKCEEEIVKLEDEIEKLKDGEKVFELHDLLKKIITN